MIARWIVLPLLTLSLVVSAAEVNGRVVNISAGPLPAFEVVLEGPGGLRLSTLTDGTGRFVFKGLTAGHYRVLLLAETGFLVTEPECSSFDLFLETSEVRSLLFKVVPTGVSVDFGKPAGGGNLDPPPVSSRSSVAAPGESFRLALRLWNVHQVSRAPDTLVFRGRFDVPSSQVTVSVHSVRLGNGYVVNGNPVRFAHLDNGELEVQLQINQFPYIGLDGDVFVIEGSVQSPNGRWLQRHGNQLCFCVSQLNFFRNRAQLAGQGFAQIRGPWSNCAEVKTD